MRSGRRGLRPVGVRVPPSAPRQTRACAYGTSPLLFVKKQSSPRSKLWWHPSLSSLLYSLTPVTLLRSRNLNSAQEPNCEKTRPHNLCINRQLRGSRILLDTARIRCYTELAQSLPRLTSAIWLVVVPTIGDGTAHFPSRSPPVEHLLLSAWQIWSVIHRQPSWNQHTPASEPRGIRERTYEHRQSLVWSRHSHPGRQSRQHDRAGGPRPRRDPGACG